MVVVGQTQINLSDIQQFRTYFNLPANDPQVMLVPNTRDPGIRRGDLEEADLDLEWAGAIARNATILYVYSQDVMDAVQYAIDQNLAPVLSMSYGQCETQTSSGGRCHAAIVGATGERAGHDLVRGVGRFGRRRLLRRHFAQPGRTVGGPAGRAAGSDRRRRHATERGDGSYWNSSNDLNHASAMSYIPEVAWNDSTTGSPSASGGGASTFFAKPAWQTGAGVPADNARDVPDVALPASPGHDGYLFFTGGKMQVVGGTSAGAPTFAAIALLLNHYLVSNGAKRLRGSAI